MTVAERLRSLGVRLGPSRPGRPLLWAAAAVSLLWAVVDSPSAGRLWIGAFATALAILAVGRLVWSRRQVHGRWVLEPPVLVAVAVATWHFAFWPMYYLGLASAGRKALYLGFVPTATSGAFFASLVGVLAIVGGVQAGLGREPTAPARGGRPVLDHRPGRLIWAIAIAGCLLVLAYAASSGLHDVGDYGQVYLQDSGLRRLYNLGIVLLLGALAPVMLAEPSGRRRLVFLGVIVMPALIITAALGSRWVAFTAVAVVLAATTVRGGRIRVAWMLVGALLLIAGGTVVKNVRSGLVSNPGDVPGVLFDRKVNPVFDLPQELGQTFLTVGGTIGALGRPPGHPAGQQLQFGKTLVMPLVAIIPSGEHLLGVTAPRPGREWAQIYFPRRYASEGYTMGFSTIAELILNFGIPGVGLGMGLLGFLLGRGWRRAVDRRSAARVYAVWAVCAFALFGVRNDLYTSLRWAIWAALAVFVVGWLQDRGLSATRPRAVWRALPDAVGVPLRARAGTAGASVRRVGRAAVAGGDARGHRENSFDAMRLLAALSVFWFHQIAILGHGSVLIPGTRETLTLGDGGLITFFVLSGYLVTSSLQRSPSPRRYLRSRFLRIYPGLLVCLGVTFVIGMMVTRVGIGSYLGDWSSYQYVLGNATIFASHTQLDLPGVFTTSIWPVVDTPLYTLRYELIFYVALLALWTLSFGRRPRVAVTVVIAVGVITIGVQHAFAVSPDRFTAWDWGTAIKFAVPFALGAVVAAVGLLDRWRLVLVAVAIAAAATVTWGSLTFQGNRTLAAVVIALGVLALGHSRPLRRLLPTPFGDLSYGIYLYGFVIQNLVLTEAVGLGDVGIALVAFVLTVCAAAASWRLVERPALARKTAAGPPQPATTEVEPQRPRIIALVAFRDEMRHLPDFFANVAPHVDGIIALDDQSVDGSAAFVAAQPSVLELLTVPPGAQDELEDGRNHRALTEAARKHGADWLLGLDADERLEQDFRQRAEVELRRAQDAGTNAMWLHFRELWDSPDQYRADGIWATKRKACLFRSSPDHHFDERRVHAFWASMPPPPEDWPQADLNIYHLRMLHPADRAARRERYRRIDPDNVWQPIGYDYLLDETDLALKTVAEGREFTPWPDGSGTAEGEADQRLQRST
jgi:peptidoglycan/LPS O-acetylase OafA/YrhL